MDTVGIVFIGYAFPASCIVGTIVLLALSKCALGFRVVLAFWSVVAVCLVMIWASGGCANKESSSKLTTNTNSQTCAYKSTGSSNKVLQWDKLFDGENDECEQRKVLTAIRWAWVDSGKSQKEEVRMTFSNELIEKYHLEGVVGNENVD